jgi:protein TonB
MSSAADVSRYTPELAVREGVTGHVTVRCTVQSSGALGRCLVRSEDPKGYAFGTATIKTAQKLVKPQVSQAGGPKEVDVTLPRKPALT